MFEMIGVLIGLAILGILALLLGVILVAVAWLVFWGRPRPKLMIIFAGLLPISTLAYVISCAICMEIVVPNQPDFFFGDFSEPVPNGYILTGLGKMPEFSYFESTLPMMHQPPLLGGIRRLELNGQIIYGAYGHLNDEASFGDGKDHGYFLFDTRTRAVTNFNTIEELNSVAGHPVHLVESQYYRSQLPARILLRKIENGIFFTPPSVAFLIYTFVLLKMRFKIEY